MQILYSFDIFDTLISRTTANPAGIFCIIKEKIKQTDIPTFVKENFVTIRQGAEIWAIENQFILNNKYDCTFDDIYKIIQTNYNLSDYQIEILKKFEIETEYENIVPIPGNIDKLKQYILIGSKVILLSDMYYNSETVRKFLLKADKIFQNIEIYMSSDTGKRKSNGSLYRYIHSRYKFDKHIHYGDNEFSDIIQAKWNNIKPLKYTPEKLMPYEKYFLNKSLYSTQAQISIGISRYLRQIYNKKSSVFKFAVSFAAPILYGYVDYIINQAKSRNFKHLYFISRDGYILKIIADIILQKTNSDIQTHYFYSSRRASRFPDPDNIEVYIKWVFSELQEYISPLFLSERFHISINDLKKFIKFKNPQKILSKKHIEIIKNVLCQNDDFKRLVINVKASQKELFIKYLKQEIDFSKNDFAFVDLNGSGRTQDCLAQIISDFYSKPIHTFYFNIMPEMQQNERSIKLAYYSTINQKTSIILELLARTLHGQTLGYKDENGTIIPILEYDNNEFFEKWGYEDYKEGIVEYSKLLSEYQLQNDIIINYLDLYISYMNYFYTKLDKETAKVVGSMPFGIYGDERSLKECAPKYTFFNLFSNKTCFAYISKARSGLIISNIAKFINFIKNPRNYGFISKKRELAYIKIGKYKINLFNHLKN